MFGDNLQSVHAKMAKTCQKRPTRKNIFLYIQQVPIAHLLMKRNFQKFASFLRELGNETYTLYHLYTFQLKKLFTFLNIIQYKIPGIS